jgi:hypothetical protein
MTYDILTIRTAQHDNGSLYPVLGDDRFPIELEDLDGSNVQSLVATALTVSEMRGSRLHHVARVKDIKADVIISDARVAVACSKWGVGDGAVAALGLNAVSRACAAHRRRGKMLVGHARYSWLRAVGAETKTGFKSTEAIRIGVVSKLDGGERRLYLTCTLPKNVSAVAVAREIVRRAARYRLAHTAIEDDETRAKFEALTTAESLRPEPKKFAFYNLPTFFFVSSASVYPAGQPARDT